jgi:hypothetical protein
MRSGMRCVSFAILILFSLPGYSQETKPDTTFLSLARKQSVSRYAAATQNQSRLYNGSDYVYYIPKDEEHPYFKSDDWSPGSIVYWDEPYENVSILYDLTIDHVIIEHNRGNPIKLLSEKVTSFTIANHTFVRLQRDEKNKIPDGFYDRLYSGKSKVYGKYAKFYEEALESRTVVPRFDETYRYYVVRDGIFHMVKTKKSLLEVFGDRKQEIKAFLRKNHIRHNDNREKSIVRVAEFYDTLTD